MGKIGPQLIAVQNGSGSGKRFRKMLREISVTGLTLRKRGHLANVEEGSRSRTENHYPIVSPYLHYCEVTYEESLTRLSSVICEAGIKPAGLSAHSLIVGGATAYAISPSDGELVA